MQSEPKACCVVGYPALWVLQCVAVCVWWCVKLRVVQCEYCRVCFVVCVTAQSWSLLFSWVSSSMCAAVCVWWCGTACGCCSVCVAARAAAQTQSALYTWYSGIRLHSIKCYHKWVMSHDNDESCHTCNTSWHPALFHQLPPWMRQDCCKACCSVCCSVRSINCHHQCVKTQQSPSPVALVATWVSASSSWHYNHTKLESHILMYPTMWHVTQLACGILGNPAPVVATRITYDDSWISRKKQDKWVGTGQ